MIDERELLALLVYVEAARTGNRSPAVEFEPSTYFGVTVRERR